MASPRFFSHSSRRQNGGGEEEGAQGAGRGPAGRCAAAGRCAPLGRVLGRLRAYLRSSAAGAARFLLSTSWRAALSLSQPRGRAPALSSSSLSCAPPDPSPARAQEPRRPKDARLGQPLVVPGSPHLPVMSSQAPQGAGLSLAGCPAANCRLLGAFVPKADLNNAGKKWTSSGRKVYWPTTFCRVSETRTLESYKWSGLVPHLCQCASVVRSRRPASGPCALAHSFLFTPG